MKYKISVIMSVYKNDNKDHFKCAVDSLLNQTYLPSEIIIVVDGLVNKGIDVLLKEYSKLDVFNIIKLKKNKGLANALNTGFLESKYEFIARMDSDDICIPSRFEKQIDFFKTNKDIQILGGQIIQFKNKIEEKVLRRKLPIKHIEMISLMKTRSPFAHPTVMFKKEVMTKTQGYSTVYFPEDYDFFVRSFLHGFKFANLDENILFFRLGEDEVSSIKRRWGKEYAKSEFKLYMHFYRINFFNLFDLLKMILLKIPLRLLPFRLFKSIYLYSTK